MGDSLVTIDSVAAWAAAIAALPAAGPLPLRTVLVTSERHAHALRRELVRQGRQDVLAGTRFTGAVTLATEILRTAGVELQPGEDALRPARLLAMFREDLALEYFDLALVRRGGGWNEAFARAIAALEAAGLTPESLPVTTAHWRDVASLWRRLDAQAGSSWTTARILREATARVKGDASCSGGPVLAAVTGHERAVHAGFVRALPEVTVASIATGPDRETNGADPASELEALQRYLFSPPEVLADPDRPRSSGRDGSVELEEHAGVEEEIEAAADWVAREILQRKTPLEGVAVLVPARDPLVGLVADRLSRLPWNGGRLPVVVAGGLPVTATTGGARVVSAVRALSSWLSAEAIASVLPTLRAPLADRQHLTHGEAMELAWSLGTVGGSGAHPAGALEWSARAAVREQELAAAVAKAGANPNGDDRTAWHLERALASLRAARPALDALVELARLVVGEAPLREIGPALAAFVREWVLDPADGAPIAPRIAEAIADLAASSVGPVLRGADALTAMASRSLSLRVPAGRFGEPGVFVGSVQDAAGLDFDAVRVIGLGEGTLPPAVREDPVLPDAMRTEACPEGELPTSADRVLRHLHAFDRVVRGTRQRIVLSAPRVDLERTEREPSSLFIEVGAAVGRPAIGTRERRSVIPDLPSLRRDAFAPAREAARAFRKDSPVGNAAWLERASSSREVPPRWSADERIDLGRIEALRAPHPLRLSDGILGPEAPLPVLPGVTPEKPISASALGTLLGCPRFFLYERVLKWSEPAAAPSLRDIEQPTYGTLFHAVMEAFYRAHGAPFVAGERSLAQWKRLADGVAERHFEAFLSTYPLVGDGLRKKELERLREDVRNLLEYDWELPGERTFFDVERPFGQEAPVALTLGGRTLYLHGYIDRLDLEGDHTLVRDLKTGSAHPRTGEEAEISAGRDLQLGVYGVVVKQLASKWGVPAKIQAAYVYPRHRGEAERAFRSDFGVLEKATKGWLELAAKMLHERLFPPTPVPGDCTYCPLKPLCGTETPRRCAEVLADESGTLGAFRDFKLEPEEA